MEVELRTETLPDGNLEVVPIYAVGGQFVPAELISGASRQTIFGHTVTLGDDALLVQKETRGRPQRFSKKHAASFIGQMADKGVRLRSRWKKTPPTVSVVKPELKLELNEDDALRISAQLATPKGIVVEKPTNLQDLQRNDGWFIAGDDLYRVETPANLIDAAILTDNEPVILKGDAVPRFLKHVQEHESRFAGIEKNQRLEGLSIYGSQHQNRLNVEGDKNSITVEPSLVFQGKGDHVYQPTQTRLRTAASKPDGDFARVPEGWIHIQRDVVSGHESAVNELRSRLGTLDSIRGEEIPQTLTTLVDATSFSSPWAVYFSSEVKHSHRIVSTPADARFSLNVVDSDGNSLLELDPRYNHERFRLSQAEIADVVARDGEWIRRENARIKIDKCRFGDIACAIRDWVRTPLRPEPESVFPPSERERVIGNLFLELGTIERGESYAEFLAKLADFEQIDVSPLPESLRSHIALRAYQHHGYNWLSFLRKFGLDGILRRRHGFGQNTPDIGSRREGAGTQAQLTPVPL